MSAILLAKKLPYLVVGLGLVMTMALAYSFLNDYQNWSDDWAGYILQAKSILQGTTSSYAIENAFMMQHSAIRSGPSVYPWGLPLMLCAESLLAGFSLSVFKYFNILCFVLLVTAIWCLAVDIAGKWQGLSMAFLFAFNPVLLHYCNHILTEIPFTLATVATFLYLERAGRPQKSGYTNRELFLLGVAAFCCFTFRTNGILILLSISLKQFLSAGGTGEPAPRYSPAQYALPYLAFAIGVLAFQRILPAGGESHVEVLREITVDTILINSSAYPVAVFDFFTGGKLSLIPALILGPIVLLGAIRSRKRTAPLSLYCLSTLAAYIIWPAAQGYRFMIPLVPFTLLFLYLGMEAAHSFKGIAVVPRAMYVIFPVVYLGICLALIGFGKLPKEEWHPFDAMSQDMFRWIRKNTAPTDVISFFKPRVMHLFTDHLSVTATVADTRQASYLVYTQPRKFNERQPSLAEYRTIANLHLVYSNSSFQVYRIGLP